MPDLSEDDRRFCRRDLVLAGAVFACALAVRLWYLIEYWRTPWWDALIMDPQTHWDLAERIAGGSGMGPYAYFRAPLYLYALAGSIKAFGDSLWPIRLFQALAGSGAAALCYVLARFFLSRPAALLAGALQALYWTNVYFDGELLTENPATLLGLAGLVCLAAADRAARDRPSFISYSYWAAGGLALGLAAITRPNFLAFAALAGLVLAARALRPAVSRVRALFPAVAFSLGAAVCAGPVTLRNIIVAEDFVLIASQGGINFWIGNHAEADGRTVVVPYPRREVPGWFLESRRDHPWFGEDVWLSSAYGAEEALQRRVSESEISAYWYGQARDEIRSRPGRALSLLLKKALFLVQAKEVGNNRDLYYHRSYFTSLGLLAVFNLSWISPLALTGAVLALGRAREWKWPLLFAGAYAVTVVAFFVTSRYRAPLMPAVMVFAGLAAERLIASVRTGGRASTDASAAARAFPALVLAAALMVANLPWPAWNDRPLRSAMHYNLGLALARKDRAEAAERELRLALAAKPFYPEAYWKLGRVMFEAGRLDEARAAFESAADQAPSYAPAHYELYRSLRALAVEETDPARRDQLGRRAWAALDQAHRLAPSLYPAPPPLPDEHGP